MISVFQEQILPNGGDLQQRDGDVQRLPFSPEPEGWLLTVKLTYFDQRED
jgi:hypothetical protein